tara:strand:- start:15221 stop:16561 length:1341 start_codon:yes stop_codon:yes gene_type:complete
MKKVVKIISFLLLISTSSLYAQGIKFEKTSFMNALAKAKEQNKLVFIDFYTVWCGPCKAMDKNVFTDAKVGELFNKEFINIKLDAEREGMQTAKKYKVGAYPTLMFVNGDGEMVYKKVGGLDVSMTISMGNGALESVNSSFSLASLQKQFHKKKNDATFLKLYFNKMIEYGKSPIEGIEAWLKIQTEIKESDVDMMEFLMQYSKYLIVGGKAEEILYTNYNEFWDIATRNEEVSLKNMKYNIVNNTRGQAYKRKNPELMRAFITSWKGLAEDRKKTGNLADYELDYLWFKKDYNVYKRQAASYIDSIVSAKSITQIRIDDKAYYENYKNTKYKPSLIGDAVLKNLKTGKDALTQKRAIEKIGYKYLRLCKKRKDYKRLMHWVDYGLQLAPSYHEIDNLKAKVLYQQGKVKEAIGFKEQALSKLPKRHKKHPIIQRELDQMKKGEKL